MSLLTRDYSLAEISHATGVNAQTIKTWAAKGFPLGGEEIVGGGGPGLRRQFSYHTVMEFAIAAALSDVANGTRDMRSMFLAARKFAHSGPNGPFQRLPGLPFHYELGETVFAVSGEKTWTEVWDGNRDTYGELRQRVGDNFISVNASNIFDSLCMKLGEHPNIVLDEGYKNMDYAAPSFGWAND